MNQRKAKLIKSHTQDFSMKYKKGWRQTYQLLKSLWNETPRTKKAKIFT